MVPQRDVRRRGVGASWAARVRGTQRDLSVAVLACVAFLASAGQGWAHEFLLVRAPILRRRERASARLAGHRHVSISLRI